MYKLMFIFIMMFSVVFITSCNEDVKEPKYTLIKSMPDENFEIRRYETLYLATTESAGDRRKTSNKNFRKLADYIFAKKRDASKGEVGKIAMTAPVFQHETEQDTWQMSFVMPAGYSFENLPVPKNEQVVLQKQEVKTFAVIRYSGRWSKENYEEHRDKLLNILESKNIAMIGNPISAAYDPPWTMPALRRNEVFIEVLISE
ncbi:MAG: heme-binding protein [Lentisphaeria bacterium]|nr:heme-binding protein [Lentisphaeria bacterium]